MRKSYSSATQNAPIHKVPKRDQAIILDVVEDLRIVDYVTSIGNIIGPKNIISVSRIANNRICMYLSSTQVADTLLKNYPLIQIENVQIKIRKLITPAKRILISNVCSSIPNYVIEKHLMDSGLKLVSPITTLKAGIPGEEFNHIESFRRQVFVTPPTDEDNALPSSLVISHEETTYRIFLSFDDLVMLYL